MSVIIFAIYNVILVKNYHYKEGKNENDDEEERK